MPGFPNPLLFFFYFIDNTSHKFWDQSPSPHYQCCLQVSETVSWHKLRCCYSANILQHWVGGGAWFISAWWSIPEFPEIFPGIELVWIIYVRYCRFKYFPGATFKELLHYIDATLEEGNFEVAVIHVGINDLMNSNNSVDKLLKNIYNMAEKCKNNCIKNVFILDIVKNNRIIDFITQEVNRRIYDDCQKETTVLLSMIVSVVTMSSKMVFIYWIVVNKV